jgi:hypothetical protein
VFIHNLDEIFFIQGFHPFIFIFYFFINPKLDEKFSSMRDFRQAISFTYGLGFQQFSHHRIHLSKLYATIGMWSFLKIMTLGDQFSYFWDLFHIKILKLIFPTYDAYFKCHFHHCSPSEKSYHFRKFQLDWWRVISQPFYGGVVRGPREPWGV